MLVRRMRIKNEEVSQTLEHQTHKHNTINMICGKYRAKNDRLLVEVIMMYRFLLLNLNTLMIEWSQEFQGRISPLAPQSYYVLHLFQFCSTHYPYLQNNLNFHDPQLQFLDCNQAVHRQDNDIWLQRELYSNHIDLKTEFKFCHVY